MMIILIIIYYHYHHSRKPQQHFPVWPLRNESLMLLKPRSQDRSPVLNRQHADEKARLEGKYFDQSASESED